MTHLQSGKPIISFHLVRLKFKHLAYKNKIFFLWVVIKQWLLAGEFSEFEYSRKTRRFWRVRVLTKTAVF
jgi:hypothetical protein